MRAIATDVAGTIRPWSVCVSVTTVSRAKTAEPIEMPFGVWTHVSPRNQVLDVGQHPPRDRALRKNVLTRLKATPKETITINEAELTERKITRTICELL